MLCPGSRFGGKMLEDWFLARFLTAMRYGMQRNGETDNSFISA